MDEEMEMNNKDECEAGVTTALSMGRIEPCG
jgi:hypothetical protein